MRLVKRSLRLLAITALVLNFQNELSAQLTYEERIEFEVQAGYDVEQVIPQGEDGFLLIAKSNTPLSGLQEWIYDYYNSALELEESKRIDLDKRLIVESSFTNDSATFTLFKHRSRGDYEIVIAAKGTNRLERTKGKLHKKFFIKEMQVLNGNAYIIGVLKKSPAVMVVNLNTGISKILPISIGNYKTKNTSITNFQLNEKDKEFFIFLKGFDSRKQTEVYMLKGKGNALNGRDFKINDTGNNNLISISASKVDDEEYVITGTYGNKTVSSSEGIFFGQLKQQKVDYLTFNKFLDLKDFLSYLSERKQNKIEKKRKKKKAKGKDLRYSYRIASHDLIPQEDGGYIFIGEAFYPTYRQEAVTTFVNGQAVTTWVSVFDGYQYTHAVVIKYDQVGNIIWDNSFKMYPTYKPFSVERFITLFDDKDEGSINLAFADSRTINAKSISESTGEILTEKTSEAIDTGAEGDQIKYSNARIDYWYDKNFIIYGYQKIKNKGKEKDKRGKRRVYYVSKVRFDN